MQLMIEIPEEIYDNVLTAPEVNGFVKYSLISYVKNGIPLPKGHGRLGDLDYLYEKFKANKCPDERVFRLIKDEPTIIEADKGGN